MITVDFVLKILMLIAFASMRLYWFNAESEANLKLPANITKRTRFRNQFRIVEFAFYVLLAIQFFFPILPFQPTTSSRMIGIVLFLSGYKLSLDGRRALGVNWTHMIDYQVKKKQALVTDGIFKYVRHPIYAGFFLVLTAVQIILASWLWVLVAAVLFPFLYQQSKREEAVLARNFGKEYLKYRQNTKMFIPYVF